jgi:hypothetical protein
LIGGLVGHHSGKGYTESDAEDLANDARVVLPDAYRGRANAANQQSAVRLKEIGPRMQLSLTKIEVGLCDGEVLYQRNTTASLEPTKRVKTHRKKTSAPKDDAAAESHDNAAPAKKAKKAPAEEQLRKRAKDQAAARKKAVQHMLPDNVPASRFAPPSTSARPRKKAKDDGSKAAKDEPSAGAGAGGAKRPRDASKSPATKRRRSK